MEKKELKIVLESFAFYCPNQWVCTFTINYSQLEHFDFYFCFHETADIRPLIQDIQNDLDFGGGEEAREQINELKNSRQELYAKKGLANYIIKNKFALTLPTQKDSAQTCYPVKKDAYPDEDAFINHAYEMKEIIDPYCPINVYVKKLKDINVKKIITIALKKLGYLAKGTTIVFVDKRGNPLMGKFPQ